MWLANIWAQIVSSLKEVQRHYKENANEHHKEQPSFKVDNQVWFWWKNIKTTQPLEKIGLPHLVPSLLNVNKITWASFACFLIAFVTVFGEIFQKNSLKFYYFIKVHVKFFAKMSFSKKLKSIYKSFYYLKANITIFYEFFCYFSFIGLISN
jgi:hypothetical protein